MRKSLATSVLAAILLSGCGPGPADRQVTTVAVVGDATESRLLAESMAGGLTEIDAAGNVVPGLARSWRLSSDGLSLVLRLREAHFADDSPITAEDVVASLADARRGRRGKLVAAMLAGITNIATPVAGTVALDLSTPQPELLELLSAPELGIVKRRAKAKSPPLAAGPYVATPDPGARPITNLRPRPHAPETDGRAPPPIDLWRASTSDALGLFTSQRAGLVLGGGLDGLAEARATARRSTFILEQPRATLTLLINQRQPLLRQTEVRRALQLAINRDELARSLYGSQGAPPVLALAPGNILGYVPPTPDWAAESFAARQLQARRLLETALAADPAHPSPDAPVVLSVAITSSRDDTAILNALASDFAAIGVELKLVRRSPAAHAKAIATGDFELALAHWQTPTDSPLPFLLPFVCGNAMAVCVPDADQMIAESWHAGTLAERLAFLQTAERLWADDAVAIGLVQPLGWTLVAPTLSGVAANRSGRHLLRNLHTTDDRKFLP